jgi:hypothetical protein
MAEVTARAGWGGEILPESLKRRWAAEQAAEAREEAQAARVREQLAEQRRADNIAASIALAQDRGEEVDMRTALRTGVGRTKREALLWMSAVGDFQDQREAAERQKRFRQFELQEAADWSADTSAPGGEVDVSQLQASRARDAKMRKQLEERAARRTVVDEARRQARYARGGGAA